MHIFTHLKKEFGRKDRPGIYPDGMVEHDEQVGQLLTLLDELGVADNTIVVYTTDNGAECFTWPDGGSTPEFPPRAKAASFTVSDAMEKITTASPHQN